MHIDLYVRKTTTLIYIRKQQTSTNTSPYKYQTRWLDMWPKLFQDIYLNTLNGIVRLPAFNLRSTNV